MRVLILYNKPVLPKTHPEAESEHEIIGTVEAVHEHLAQAGFAVQRLGLNQDLDVLVTALKADRPNVIFNLFEGLANDPDTEAQVAYMLERLRVPFTGCPSRALRLARRKHVTKRLLRDAGLPTPEALVVHDLPTPECRLNWPVIAKPALLDASVGIDQGSVTTDQPHLDARVAHLLGTYGPPVLVEEFIAGRELSVALIEAPGLRALPLSEIRFLNNGSGQWPITTYDAKWKPGSQEYMATPPTYPADVVPGLAAELSTLACRAFRLLGCRDYACVDFRVSPAGKPFILEINPNPDFSPTACLSGALESAGLSHAEFTTQLVRAAAARSPR